MPVAIDLSTLVAISTRVDRKLVVRSENYDEAREMELDRIGSSPAGHWSDAVFGVAAVLERTGHRLRGANLLIASDVPIGAGLSSSAAVEVACGYALLEAAGFSVDLQALALACQKAEHEFLGTRCGIMDQFICCFAREGHALLLDTRLLECEYLPLPAEASVVVCNTMVRHELAASEYNARRAECEAGVRALRGSLPGVRALRDVSLAGLEHYGGTLAEKILKRCRHVISENERVRAAARALQRHDLAEFGRLMGESHRSLRDDYEVSCRELDVMVELAGALDGVYGARMTGGGFGGCTVNLVRAEKAQDFARVIAGQYEQTIGRKPDIYICATAQGVEELSSS